MMGLSLEQLVAHQLARKRGREDVEEEEEDMFLV